MDPHTTAALMALLQFATQIKVNGFASWLIQELKANKYSVTSWITEDTPWVSRFVSLVAAAATAQGIGWTFHSGTLMITGLGGVAVLHVVWNVSQNYLMQHAWYKAVFSKITGSPTPNPPAGPAGMGVGGVGAMKPLEGGAKS